MPEEDMRVLRLILKDGTVLNNSQCGYYSKLLWCFLKNMNFSEAFQHFSDANKFETVIFDIGKDSYFNRTIYSGFSELKTISQGENQIDVCITGDHIDIEEELYINGKKVGDDEDGTVYNQDQNQS